MKLSDIKSVAYLAGKGRILISCGRKLKKPTWTHTHTHTHTYTNKPYLLFQIELLGRRVLSPPDLVPLPRALGSANPPVGLLQTTTQSASCTGCLSNRTAAYWILCLYRHFKMRWTRVSYLRYRSIISIWICSFFQIRGYVIWKNLYLTFLTCEWKKLCKNRNKDWNEWVIFW